MPIYLHIHSSLLLLLLLQMLQVILIHLSNLTGMADDYNKRTMSLLVSDIGTIVMGVTAAIASGYVKVRGKRQQQQLQQQHVYGSSRC